MKKTDVIEATVVKETGVAVVPQNTQALVVDDYERNILKDSDLGSFYSMKPQTPAEKIKLYNAINTPDARLADFINMTIKAKDVAIEIVELIQEETGELAKVPRIILIDDAGKSYACCSVGVFSGLKKIIKFFGEPTWTTPVEMRVKQVVKGKKSMLTLELV